MTGGELILWAQNLAPEVEGAEQVDRLYHLVDELQAIKTETAYRVAMELIEERYALGEAIVRSGLYKPGTYGQDLVGRIAELFNPTRNQSASLGAKRQAIWLCLRFYSAVEEVGSLEAWLNEQGFDKRLTWKKVRAALVKNAGTTDEELADKPEENKLPPAAVYTRATAYSKRHIGDLWTKADHEKLELLLRSDYGVTDDGG